MICCKTDGKMMEEILFPIHTWLSVQFSRLDYCDKCFPLKIGPAHEGNNAQIPVCTYRAKKLAKKCLQHQHFFPPLP